MKKYLLSVITGLFSMIGFAHNPDVSTTMLVEQEHHVWVLKLSASLTAFQQEIRNHFSETPYKTPEEFQQMVLQHIKNNLTIKFNEGQEITLGQGYVKLGHETNVVFEVLGVPSQINSVYVQNRAFKDIYHNQSSFLLLKNGFKKEHFVLNEKNNHAIKLVTKDNEFVLDNKNEAGFFSKTGIYVLIGIVVLSLLYSIKIRNTNLKDVCQTNQANA